MVTRFLFTRYGTFRLRKMFFLTALGTVSFSRRTLLHRVIYSCYWTQHYAIVMGCDDASLSLPRQDVPLVGFTYRSNEPSCLIAGNLLFR